MTEVPRLIGRTLASSSAPPRDALKAAGINREDIDNARSDDAVCATVMLNDCSLCFNPPKKKHIPSTRRRLDNMDPRREACTMLTFP